MNTSFSWHCTDTRHSCEWGSCNINASKCFIGSPGLVNTLVHCGTWLATIDSSQCLYEYFIANDSSSNLYLECINYLEVKATSVAWYEKKFSILANMIRFCFLPMAVMKILPPQLPPSSHTHLTFVVLNSFKETYKYICIFVVSQHWDIRRYHSEKMNLSITKEPMDCWLPMSFEHYLCNGCNKICTWWNELYQLA